MIKALLRNAEYWIGDIIEDGIEQRWEITDIAHSPHTETLLYEIEQVAGADYTRKAGWYTEANLPCEKIIEESARPEPLSVDLAVDTADPDTVDEKLDLLEKAQREAGASNSQE